MTSSMGSINQAMTVAYQGVHLDESTEVLDQYPPAVEEALEGTSWEEARSSGRTPFDQPADGPLHLASTLFARPCYHPLPMVRPNLAGGPRRRRAAGAGISPRAVRLAEAVLAGAILYLAAVAWTSTLRSSWHGSGLLAAVFVGSLAAIAFLIVALVRFRAEAKAGLALALASAGLLLYAAETLLAAFSRPVPRAKAAERLGVAFDRRTPFEALRDLRAAGEKAFPPVGPAWFLSSGGLGEGPQKLFPLAGLSRTATLFCNEAGEYVVYRSDQHGFNNSPPDWPERADLVLVGDSFTHGACVAQGDDVAGQLRRGGISAINLGAGSDGPLLELATLAEYAGALRPRLVVWLYFEGNDLENLKAELESPLLRRYLEDETFSQGLAARQPEVDALLEAHFGETLRWELSRGPLAGPARILAPYRRKVLWRGLLDVVKLRRIRERVGSILGPVEIVGEIRAPDPAFAAVLERARRLAASWGGELVFVYLPDYQRFTGEKDFPARELVLNAVDELGISVLDLVPVFERAEDPLSYFPFRVYGHYTPQGYTLVAREIEDYWATGVRSPDSTEARSDRGSFSR